MPVLNRVINEAGGEDENMNGCLEHVNTILAIYSFSSILQRVSVIEKMPDKIEKNVSINKC